MLRSSLRSALALVLPVAGALAISSAAQANVRTQSPGATCTEPTSNDGGMEPNSNYVFNIDGSMYVYAEHNSPNRGYNFSCPMARALPLSTTGFSDIEVRFSPTGQHREGLRWANCEVVAYRPDGTVLLRKEKTIDIPPMVYNPNTGLDYAPVVTLDFGATLNQTANKGYVHLMCYAPSGVSLRSYYFSENDGVDNN